MLEDRIAPANFLTLHNFTGGSDGSIPQAGVIVDNSGNLYGTTKFGGADYSGTLYELGSNRTFTTLHTFVSGSEGSLIRDSSGNFYGTTTTGGNYGQGSVFELSANGTFTNLHSFNGNDGSIPEDALVTDSKGDLFGTTFGGGPLHEGTVFELSPNGSGGYNFSVLHSFSGTDGNNLMAGVLMDSQGNIYGTTTQGGLHYDGTVFKLSPNGSGGYNFTTLHNFDGSDGSAAVGGLIVDSNGNLFGTTQFGGAYSSGTVFELSSNGSSFTTIHSFSGSDGFQPTCTLLMDSEGNLYGTTSGFQGTVFELSPSGTGSYTITTLHKFIGSDGYEPFAGLTADSSGNIYGTTEGGGTYNDGTIFELTGVISVAPVVTSSTTNLPANASSMTINGKNFDSNAAHDSVTFNDGVTGTVTSATSTSLTVSLIGLSNLTAGTALDASVTVNGLSSGNAMQVATIAPVVTSSTANLPANAAITTIYGYGFDDNTSNDTVAFNNGVTGTVTSATSTSLTINLSGLDGLTTGTVLDASVTVNGVGSGSAVQVATISSAVTSSTVQSGQTAKVDFWNGKDGQALIESLNGGGTSTALADWLANSFSNLYGANAGNDNLTGETNYQIAAFFKSLFHDPGMKLETQVLSTALNIYATTESLGGTAATAYGFTVTASGLGADWQNVGSDGAAFGVANNTVLSVYQILLAANQQAKNGVLYNGDSTLDHEAEAVFKSINEEGNI